MKTLFVSDLDGTLLNDDARLSARTIAMLNEAISAGALFTVATARTAATVDVLLQDVDMQLPAIVMTGATLWDCKKKDYKALNYFDEVDAGYIFRLFAQYDVCPFTYTLPYGRNILEVYYDNPHPSQVDISFKEARATLPLKHFVTGKPSSFANVLLFYASGNRKTMQDLSKRIAESTRLSVSCYDDIYNPGTSLIEVFAGGVSKARAIQNLRGMLGVDRVVVFGDNLNDLPMFRVADTSVAVENSALETLKAADVVIGKNTDDSVAKFILSTL